jgi:hypothetical protein
LWNFSNRIARQEGIEDFGLLIGQYSGANNLHPKFCQSLSALPTLYRSQNSCGLNWSGLAKTYYYNLLKSLYETTFMDINRSGVQEIQFLTGENS